MVRLLFATTHPVTIDRLLRGQLGFLRRSGFDVHVVSAPGDRLARVAEREGVTVHTVPMTRAITPVRDLLSLARLLFLLRRLRPDVVNASTPKAGLLAMIAARAVGVPHRIYLVRGLRLETLDGWRRAVSRMSERVAAAAASRVVCVSGSLRDRFVGERLAPGSKVQVLGAGSSNGIPVPATGDGREAAGLRARLGLTHGATIGYFGRLTRDKGVADLVAAFVDRIAPRRPDARLVVIGDEEPGDPLPATARSLLDGHAAITRVSWVDDPHTLYPAIDVLAFPSYREGMPNVPLEAAAHGVPTVGYRATGLVDAVVDGETGTLVAIGDRDALGRALLRYLDDDALRVAHGEAAARRVRREFDPEAVWGAWRDLYRRAEPSVAGGAR